MQAERQKLIRGKDIADYPVRNPQGEDLGTIKDIMIDIDHGCIAYAALAFGGFMGLGDKLFAVPWEAFQYSADEKYFILDVPKGRLETASGFDEDTWPVTTKRDWLTGLYMRYGYMPYWERRTR